MKYRKKLYLCTMTKKPQLDFYEMCTGVTAFSSTRHGGCSRGSYATFNINRYCGDSEENISKNRKALCQMLGIGDDCLLMPHQVHETKVAKIDEEFFSMSTAERQEVLEGVDALMTNLRGICIGVSTADCIPVLLYDGEQQAICAIHAGWRGTVKRIVEKAIEAMVTAYGTEPRHVKAQIGPGIHLDSFEVGDEVYETFLQEGFDMNAISKQFLSTPPSTLHHPPSTSKWHIDLPECNRQQLMASGVLPEHIRVSPVCTFEQTADYFSARRLGINSGRIFTGIMFQPSYKYTI